MIRLFFDIRYIGYKPIIKSGFQRGVPRYVLSLLEVFSKHPEIDLQYYCTAPFNILELFRKEWHENPEIIPKKPLNYSVLKYWYYKTRTYFNKAIDLQDNVWNCTPTFTKRQLSKADLLFLPTPSNGLVLTLHSMGFSEKHVVTVHDLIPVKFPEHHSLQIVYLLEKMLKFLKEVPLIFTVSQSTKNDLCEFFGIPEERIVVTYLGADQTQFHPKKNRVDHQRILKKYKIPSDKYFFCLAPVTVMKNVLHLVRCFYRLIKQENIKDLSLVISGCTQSFSEGDLFDLFKLLEKPIAKDRIILTGSADEEDLVHLYSNAVAFTFPSLYEGFGLPPLEAMQCATPVLSSNASSLPEVIGDAGILIDPSDEDLWCQEMLNLYTDEELRKNLSNKGLEQAKKFTWEKTANKMIESFHRI
jgi:glycosyltransferase involved in cell wall biosynthesis